MTLSGRPYFFNNAEFLHICESDMEAKVNVSS